MNLIATIAGLYSSAMLDAVAAHALAFWLSAVISTGICIALFTAERPAPRIWSW